MARRNTLKRSQTRVFTLEGGAGPGTSAVYQGLARSGAPDWPGGTITPVRAPSSIRYGDFDTIDTILGQRGLPTLSVAMLMRRDISDMLTLFQKGCLVDVQIHAGECTDPTDFLTFETAFVLEGARLTNWSADQLGAFDGDEEAVAREELPFTGAEIYQIKGSLRDSEIGGSEIVQEIVGLSVCDALSCGECGAPSDGASVILAVTKSHGGSPGLAAEVIYTDDAGSSVGSTIVDTLGANEDPTDLGCSGSNIVVISAEDNALHYANLEDILLAQESWTRVDTGFVALKLPNRFHSRGRTLNWIAADDGYVYFSSDITGGVEPQTAGGLTTEDLQDIHSADDDNLVAVGDNNAVIVTEDGGDNWASVTGPAVGVNLKAVWMITPDVWFVGTAGGELYYTLDAGASWTIKGFSGSGSGSVEAIAFATTAVGFLSHTLNGVARLFRTIDGGASWTQVPGGGVSLTDADRLNRLAVASSAPGNIRANLVHAGGLGANATDGIWLKVA